MEPAPEQSHEKGNEPTILLTGLPRSGTTLACALLHRLPNVVALDEPSVTARTNYLRAADLPLQKKIRALAHRERRSILASGNARSKHVRGEIGSNHFGARRHQDGLRVDIAKVGVVTIDKPLTPDFLLVVKSPWVITARLHAFVGAFPTFAIVRNPLSVLGSWNSVRPIFPGAWAKKLAILHPELAPKLDAATDLIETQITILSWFFTQYATLLPPTSVIRYEDIFTSGGSALAVITPAATTLHQSLQSRNTNPLYNHHQLREIGKRLLASEGSHWNWYTRADVEALLDEMAPAHD